MTMLFLGSQEEVVAKAEKSFPKYLPVFDQVRMLFVKYQPVFDQEGMLLVKYITVHA